MRPLLPYSEAPPWARPYSRTARVLSEAANLEAVAHQMQRAWISSNMKHRCNAAYVNRTMARPAAPAGYSGGPDGQIDDGRTSRAINGRQSLVDFVRYHNTDTKPTGSALAKIALLSRACAHVIRPLPVQFHHCPQHPTTPQLAACTHCRCCPWSDTQAIGCTPRQQITQYAIVKSLPSCDRHSLMFSSKPKLSPNNVRLAAGTGAFALTWLIWSLIANEPGAASKLQVLLR